MTRSEATRPEVTLPKVTRPVILDERYGAVLRSRKSDFLSTLDGDQVVHQHGAALIATHGWPGWPAGLATAESVIETYVAGADTLTATSDNEPFVSAWTPLVAWMNTTVRSALANVGVQLSGDAYITASLTATATLEGTAHMDDDQFVPTDSVGVVAIIGELAGPRVSSTPIGRPHPPPMASVTFADAVLGDFAADTSDHCAASANELVVFPQFGQLHAGPAAHHVAALARSRQLLVMRATIDLATIDLAT